MNFSSLVINEQTGKGLLRQSVWISRPGNVQNYSNTFDIYETFGEDAKSGLVWEEDFIALYCVE